MAATCPAGFDVKYLRAQVQATYDRVAREPHGRFHFHRGPDYACEYLGYDRAEIEMLPEACTARFAGVGNPLRIPETDPRITGIRPGDIVLDHACGAGMDLLLAARRVGATGKAIGVDMTPAMRWCATAAADMAGLGGIVDVRAGFFENLPLEDASVDVLISNGVVNLSPDKMAVFREIQRVLKPGGRLFMADVAVGRELTLDARGNPDLWAACIAGALVEGELVEIAATVGLSGGRIIERFDCFRDASAEGRLAKDLDVRSVNFYAYK